MEEIWRDIKGYEGRYQVSSLGRIYSFYKKDVLKPKSNGKGYYFVYLCKKGEGKVFYIHRLVAQAFIDNPNNYPEVNHKDENKENNGLHNLEWCDRKYNVNYGNCREKMKINHSDVKYSKNPNSKKVYCVTTGRKFDCMKEASEYYQINHRSISDCCRGRYKSAGKHPVTGEKLIWRYINKKGDEYRWCC